MEEKLFHWGATIIVISTFLHTFLPPWDFLNDFPTLQKYYKLIIYIVGYTAGNARSTVYRQISVNNPSGPNANLPTLVTEAVEAKAEKREPAPIADFPPPEAK